MQEGRLTTDYLPLATHTYYLLPTASTYCGAGTIPHYSLQPTTHYSLLLLTTYSAAGPTPAVVISEIGAEVLNLLGVNLDLRGSFRGAQLLFMHSLRIRPTDY